MDIRMEKGSSGAWETRKKRRFRLFSAGLGRLRRLWVAVAVVWLVLVAVSGYILMPRREQVERAMVFEVTEEVRRYDGLAFVAESPRGIYESARREGFDHWIAAVRAKRRIGPDADPDFARIRENYLREMDTPPGRRFTLILLLALAWAGPTALFYMAVRIMEWVAGEGRE